MRKARLDKMYTSSMSIVSSSLEIDATYLTDTTLSYHFPLLASLAFIDKEDNSSPFYVLDSRLFTYLVVKKVIRKQWADLDNSRVHPFIVWEEVVEGSI